MNHQAVAVVVVLVDSRTVKARALAAVYAADEWVSLAAE